MAPGNVARAEEHFWGLRIMVLKGNQYLGGYIRDEEAERRWLKEKIEGWTEFVNILAGSSKSPCSLLTQDWKIPSSRSGLSCRG